MSSSSVISSLEQVLADTFVLYFKTHGFHWNVEGRKFNDLHAMFMEQYTEMWEAIDEIAERLRALDSYAASSLKDILEATSLSEASIGLNDMEMVAQLAQDHASLAATLKTGIKAAVDNHDDATAGLLTDRLSLHEKTAWMLRSIAK